MFYEYINLECVHIHAICRVNPAEYGIRIRVAESQEYVNTCSTRMLNKWGVKSLVFNERSAFKPLAVLGSQ